jgi:hypothetical protein
MSVIKRKVCIPPSIFFFYITCCQMVRSTIALPSPHKTMDPEGVSVCVLWINNPRLRSTTCPSPSVMGAPPKGQFAIQSLFNMSDPPEASYNSWISEPSIISQKWNAHRKSLHLLMACRFFAVIHWDQATSIMELSPSQGATRFA